MATELEKARVELGDLVDKRNALVAFKLTTKVTTDGGREALAKARAELEEAIAFAREKLTRAMAEEEVARIREIWPGVEHGVESDKSA